MIGTNRADPEFNFPILYAQVHSRAGLSRVEVWADIINSINHLEEKKAIFSLILTFPRGF